MLKILFSIYVWVIVLLTIVIYTPIFLVIWFLTVLFDKKLILLHYFSNIWGSSYNWFIPRWNVKVIGKENLNYSSNKIYVANHQSLEDIIIIYRIGVPFRWVSKAEVFKIPVFGWLMHLKGDIKLKRSSKASIKKMMTDAEKVLKKGCSLVIFPEGTRSRNGELGNFKEGAFALAHKTQKALVPVVINGTIPNLIYSGFLFKMRHQVTVNILPEIPYDSFKDKEYKEIAEMVKNIIKDELNRIKSEM